MKRHVTLFILLLCSVLVWSQEAPLVVAPGPVGTLNNVIRGDTLANGQRTPGRVYVLRRGVPYLLSASLDFNYPLHIRAEAGAGDRPMLVMSPSTGGATIATMFLCRNNLTLEGLYITARDILGNYSDEPFRTGADNVKLNIINTQIDEVGQAAFRVANRGVKINILDSYFSRLGRPNNPDNGRFIDNRGNVIDSVVVRNSVVYNVTSRFFRANNTTQVITNLILDQNTFVASGQHGFDLGIVNNLRITNNVIANAIFLGRDAQASTPRTIIVVAPPAGATTVNWVVRNNNFFLDPGYAKSFPKKEADGDSSTVADPFSPRMIRALDSLGIRNTNISEVLTFVNPSKLALQFQQAWFDKPSGTNLVAAAEPWDHSGITANSVYSLLGGASAIPRYTNVHNFLYPNTATSFRAGTRGQPLGAGPNYLTNTEDIFKSRRLLLYPNPVAEKMFLANPQGVNFRQVILYNQLGQQIRSWSNIRDQIFEMDMQGLQNGVYILSVVDEKGHLSSRKIVKR